MLHPFSVGVQPQLCHPNAAQAWAGMCSSSSLLTPAPPVNHSQNTNPEVFPTFGMREEKNHFYLKIFFRIFFFFFFFLVLGVVFLFPPNLSGPLLHIFFFPRCTPLKSVSLCVYHCRLGWTTGPFTLSVATVFWQMFWFWIYIFFRIYHYYCSAANELNLNLKKKKGKKFI